jgi:hypothetical protein
MVSDSRGISRFHQGRFARLEYAIRPRKVKETGNPGGSAARRRLVALVEPNVDPIGIGRVEGDLQEIEIRVRGNERAGRDQSL